MRFTQKRIFLADDDPDYRGQIRSYLEAGGHTVVIEAINADDAWRQLDSAVSLGVDTAVLDCRMPDKGDGPAIARELNARIRRLLVVSISSRWDGQWRDPLFDSAHLHRVDSAYDIHGRQSNRGPDFEWRSFPTIAASIQAIGAWEFSDDNREVLGMLENFSHLTMGKERG